MWRFKPDQADSIGNELARSRLEIQNADTATARAITLDWESRLLRLLATDAAAAAELRDVVAELRQLSAGQPTRGAVLQHAEDIRNSTAIQIAGDAH